MKSCVKRVLSYFLLVKKRQRLSSCAWCFSTGSDPQVDSVATISGGFATLRWVSLTVDSQKNSPGQVLNLIPLNVWIFFLVGGFNLFEKY